MRERNAVTFHMSASESVLSQAGIPAVANAVVNHVVDVPFGIVIRIENEIRRLEDRTNARAGTGWRSIPPWQSGAIHGVDLHAIDEILVREENRIIHARSVALH